MVLFIPTEDGSFVSQLHMHIVEAVREYDSRLDVRWIPPDKRDGTDPPFAIIERTSDGQEVVAFYADELDERILERIYLADKKNGNVNDRVEAHNRAAREVRRRQFIETVEEQSDLALHVLRSNKIRYKHNGMVFE